MLGGVRLLQVLQLELLAADLHPPRPVEPGGGPEVQLKKIKNKNKNVTSSYMSTITKLPPYFILFYIVLYFIIYIYREREMFYLTTHSTHFIYGYMASDIWLKTILMVRKEGNLQGFFYMHRSTDRITHTTAFVKPVVEHWLEGEIAQWVHPMKDRSDNPPHHDRTLYL